MKHLLSQLAKEIEGAKLAGGDAEIFSLCADSRLAEAGDLFFCFRGTHADAHAYAAEAEERGAAAIVCEQDVETFIPRLIVKDGRDAMARLSAAFYGHPERRMKVVGVTGTNGKTTTTHMLYSILAAAGKKAGLIGTLGARFSGREVPPSLTTPDPIALFSLLAEMADAGTEIVVMEVSAHALALSKTDPIRFELAVFTNLTQDHLDFFGDMEAYGAAKRRLFTAERCREAVLNADDPFSHSLEGVPFTTYGLDTPADSFALIEEESASGMRLLLNLEDVLVEADLPMAGRFNVSNALAAAVAAQKLGIREDAIAEGLEHTYVEGRLERVASYRGAEIFVDFAHTPDGLEKSLGALRPYCRGKLYVLFGCGGNRDRGKRKLMGETADRLADFVILTSDNPRYEDPVTIISEIAAGIASQNYVEIEERERATLYALGLLGEGDILLVAGKGAEREQEIMGIKYSYNDKAVIMALTEKS